MPRILNVLLVLLTLWASVAAAQSGAARTGTGERSLAEWLARVQDASRHKTFIGNFVVSSPSGALSSARIWHVCDGQQQIERVEALTGAPRSTFRRNDEVVTFLPESRVVRIERHDFVGLFSGQVVSTGSVIGQLYAARQTGVERVAGFDADVVLLQPRDALRYGYRLWSEKKTGLVLKLQTLAQDGQVLEQVAFSELQLDALVSKEKLVQMMSRTEGWRVERSDMVKTGADAEGWALKRPVPGFEAVSAYRRPGVDAAGRDAIVQWVFSDGLASVSLFFQPADRFAGHQEGHAAEGATHTLRQRLKDAWLTAVGEVPLETLQAFAAALERAR